MIKTWIKHKIYEYCIDIIYQQIFNNFILPKYTDFLIGTDQDVERFFSKEIETSKELLKEIQIEIEKEILKGNFKGIDEKGCDEIEKEILKRTFK